MRLLQLDMGPAEATAMSQEFTAIAAQLNPLPPLPPLPPVARRAAVRRASSL